MVRSAELMLFLEEGLSYSMEDKDKSCKCVVIALYWGGFPSNFNFWLRSCEYNKAIDFLIVTDNRIEGPPKNVRVLDMSFSGFKKLAEEKIGRRLHIKDPHKLCDLKPCYGSIFEDFIEVYDYWAHCDMDMIFGDIMYFLNKYDLIRYDRFLPYGHLCFYRNNKECNERFWLEADGRSYAEETFNTYENTIFDEIGMKRIYEAYKFPWFKSRIFIDVRVHTKRMKEVGINYKHQAFLWDKGKVFHVYYDKKDGGIKYKECIYIHFQRRNMEKRTYIPESFWITKDKFVDDLYNGNLSKQDLDKINGYPGELYEICEDAVKILRCQIYRVIHKIMRILKIEKKRVSIKLLSMINPYYGPRNFDQVITKNG